MILTVKTDQQEAQVALYKDGTVIDDQVWVAHRELSATILLKIDELLERNKLKTNDLRGLVAFKGPGSFTGLRIGLSVANSLAYGLNIPIVSTTGKDWIESGQKRLQNNEDEEIAMPEYGGEANITKPRK